METSAPNKSERRREEKRVLSRKMHLLTTRRIIPKGGVQIRQIYSLQRCMDRQSAISGDTAIETDRGGLRKYSSQDRIDRCELKLFESDEAIVAS